MSVCIVQDFCQTLLPLRERSLQQFSFVGTWKTKAHQARGLRRAPRMAAKGGRLQQEGRPELIMHEGGRKIRIESASAAPSPVPTIRHEGQEAVRSRPGRRRRPGRWQRLGPQDHRPHPPGHLHREQEPQDAEEGGGGRGLRNSVPGIGAPVRLIVTCNAIYVWGFS